MYGSDALKESDKILISSYVDGELNHDQTQTIEALIENDEEARSYLNQVKMIKNELNAFFNESMDSDELKAASEFVALKRDKAKQATGSGIFSKIFSSGRPLPAYSVAAVLALSIGLNFYLVNDSPDSNLISMGYSSEIIEKTALKTRSLNEGYNDLFKKSLVEMHDEKNKHMRLSYGAEVFDIKLSNLLQNMEPLICYEGTIVSIDKDFSFVFCIDPVENTQELILSPM
jgi:hypothetical protein